MKAIVALCVLLGYPWATAQDNPRQSRTQDTAMVHLTSNPSGADIQVDGTFRGNTPSDLRMPSGEHVIKMIFSGQEWTRNLQVTSGEISLHANFDSKEDDNAPSQNDRVDKEKGLREKGANAIRSIAERIKRCPSEFVVEHKWGKDPQDQERISIGPPQNVLWDIAASDSLRTPYVAYIQYSVDTHSEPVGSSEKHINAYLLAWQWEKQSWPKREYRYEFDLQPDGPELRNVVSRPEAESAWKGDQVPGRCWGDQSLGKTIGTQPK